MSFGFPFPRPLPLLAAVALLTAACGGSGGSPSQPPPEDPTAPIAVPAKGTATTLDVGTWNVEWFGDPGNGPSDEALQAARVRDVMKGMELDVWGLQEVVGASAFTQLLGTLPGYAGFLANDPMVEGGAASYSDFGNQEQKVAFVYRTSVVQVTGARIILADWDYAFAGRPPLEVRIRATVGGATVDGVVVVLHAKAGADVESRDRRASGAGVLEGYLDATWPDTPVWVIGDFNDDVDTSILAGQPSPYANFVTSAAWSFPTGALSASGVTSTLGYADMIDHHLVSDEVLTRYQAGSAEAYRVDTYIPGYGDSTSDHLPVLTRYTLAGAAR